MIRFQSDIMGRIARKIRLLFTDPDARFSKLVNLGFFDFIPDEKYIQMRYMRQFGEKCDLINPRTFNEKLQWLKLHDRKPIYTAMADKYAAKKYVAGKIGKEYIIPTLGVWDDPDDIDFDKLPDRFVLKCTHNSGLGMCICRDRSKLDIPKVKKELRKGLRQNYYLSGREWPYKNIKRRIIAEKYMEDSSSACLSVNDLNDYKLMCFNGKVKCTFVCSERSENLKVTFFDNDWNRLPFERHYPASDKEIQKPENFDTMIALAEKLSEDIPFVRVDLYNVDGKIYFGELTFYPGCGFEEFSPDKWDRILGDWLVLPGK